MSDNFYYKEINELEKEIGYIHYNSWLLRMKYKGFHRTNKIYNKLVDEMHRDALKCRYQIRSYEYLNNLRKK